MDSLTIIKRVMDEHRVIMGRLKLVGESLSDKEALISIEEARAGLINDYKSTTSEKRSKLEQTLTVLQAGLKNHYAFEEETLPPLLGELLMEALKLEHKELLAEMERVKALIHNVNFEGLTRSELLNEESLMYESINRIRRQKEDHLNREETMLMMLQKVLERVNQQL